MLARLSATPFPLLLDMTPDEVYAFMEATVEYIEERRK